MLILRTFSVLIVRKQPQPVLVKGEPFETEVCLLINAAAVNSAKVRCRIIPEEDVGSALVSDSAQPLSDQMCDALLNICT